MHLPTPDAAAAAAAHDPKAETSQHDSPVSCSLESKQQRLAAAGRRHSTDASCGPDSCDSPCHQAAAAAASAGPEACDLPYDRPTVAAETSCGPEACASPCDAQHVADVAESRAEEQQAHSMHSSSGHRSDTHMSSRHALRDDKPDPVNSYDDATPAGTGRDPPALRRSQQGPPREGHERRDAATRQSEQHVDGQLLEHRGKGKGEEQWSRGLQLPQKLSISSLARHAGVDRAFMQVTLLFLLFHGSITRSLVHQPLFSSCLLVSWLTRWVFPPVHAPIIFPVLN